MRAVLFGGADIHNYGYVRPYLDGAYIVCCDSGARHAMRLNAAPDAALGDFDSVSDGALEFCRAKGAEFIRVPRAKDFTDMELGIRHALEKQADEILIFGAMGGRLDHTAANIHALLAALRQGVEAVITDENCSVRLTDSRAEFSSVDGATVSLIPLTETASGITTEGFLYPLTNETLSLGSTRGISNELLGDTGAVTLRSGVLIVIQTRNEEDHAIY